MNPNTVTIGEVRFSYCNVFTPQTPFNNPQGEPKFSVTILVPKSNAQAKAAIDAAINAAIEAGVAAKWGGVKPPVPAICIHDGDGPRPSDGAAFGDECRGCWVFTASCKADRPPFVVDGNVQKILDPRQVYSGCYGYANVSFFAYNNAGKKGIGCGLNGIQKTRDGEPLGSSITAEEAFSAMPQAAAPTPQAAPSWGAAPAQQTAPAAAQAWPAGPGYAAPQAQPSTQPAWPAQAAPGGWGVATPPNSGVLPF